ncbi:hypothetical protein ACP70R_037796 [Stipagrostis hirtigluma subsp. patula]
MSAMAELARGPFTFGTADVAALRRGLCGTTATTFEMLTGHGGHLARALQIPADEDVRLAVLANFQGSAWCGRRRRRWQPSTYVRSTADFLVLRGRPPATRAQNKFLVSDHRYAGFHLLDFGWGKPVYGGPALASFGVTFVVTVRSGESKDAMAVLVVLPRPAVDRFASKVEMLVKAGYVCPPFSVGH